MSRIPQLRWGLAGEVPADAVSAWGCRAIVTQAGDVDFVPDRIDWQGDAGFLPVLERELPLAQLRDNLAQLLASGQMRGTERRLFTIHESQAAVVVANTNGSAGYCYVAAFPGKDDASAGTGAQPREGDEARET